MLGNTCLFQFWFSQCVCPAVGLLDHKAVLFPEWHCNMYSIIYETSHQSRFDARHWMLGAGALGRPRGMAWGGRREEVSGWGTHVYLWRIHLDIWQNQYNIAKPKNKIKKMRKKWEKKWNVLDLQCYISFRCTALWNLYFHIYLYQSII